MQFRQWATNVLHDFAIRGYVLDKERLKNGAFFSKKYFDDLLAEIREIRASERIFYQKITDIYATAMDYSKDAETTKTFFATVQNKLHYAIHGQTAAELIFSRIDAEKSHLGLNTWKNAPEGKIIKTDVSVAKNYLTEHEIKSLDRIVTMYLDYAEDLEAVRRYSPQKIEKAFSFLAETDEKLKSSSVAGVLLLQKMLINIMEKKLNFTCYSERREESKSTK